MGWIENLMTKPQAATLRRNGIPIFITIVVAAAAALLMSRTSTTTTKVINADTSLTFLYQNNLDFADDVNHVGAILLDPMTYTAAALACYGISERLISQDTLQSHLPDFTAQLSYLPNQNRVRERQEYWIAGAVLIHTQGSLISEYAPTEAYSGRFLPVLCSQSFETNDPYVETAASGSQLTVKANGNHYVGFRNKKSFRFLGIRYAEEPARFEHSKLYRGDGGLYDATKHGSQCLQKGEGSADCLFLNIQTPYIPKEGSKVDLRPVHLWIHGGAFEFGTGSDPNVDGGNMASREDIVTVSINYRLSTLGFFAVPGTELTGNWGIGDQIIALDWIIANIASFGGDPSRITIDGQSAGAASVRALLGSPRAVGKFIGAIAQSNLGGGASLGLKNNYGSTYSSYLTSAASFAISGAEVFASAGCTQPTLAEQIACLKAYSGPIDITSFDAVARYIVQDDFIITNPDLSFNPTINPNIGKVPIIFGITADDGASIMAYNRECKTLRECIAANLGISLEWADRVLESGLFPIPTTDLGVDITDIPAIAFNISSRINTDTMFRCIDQATVYAWSQSSTSHSGQAYYYESTRGYPHTSYNPNNLDDHGTISAEYPNGNPNTPYYKPHSADIPIAFGNVPVLRDRNDLYTVQLTTAYFGEFIRSGRPVPRVDTMRLRGVGYESVVEAMTGGLNGGEAIGEWAPIGNKREMIKFLDYPPKTTGFVDVEQCAWLGYPLDYYLNRS